jgi:hypothetical protein
METFLPISEALTRNVPEGKLHSVDAIDTRDIMGDSLSSTLHPQVYTIVFPIFRLMKHSIRSSNSTLIAAAPNNRG